MATQNSKKAVVDGHNSKTAIGSFNGTFDYPSSRGLGIDVIDYQRRNPHPSEKTPLPIRIKMKDLPHSINRDLRDAARKGELREELNRHIGLLETNKLADVGTIKLLRGHERELTGHAACDLDELDIISDVIGTLSPKEA
jgi:hypothetical protein